jgi:hypothetical protein
MCFSLLTMILLVVGRCGVADAAAPGCQTSRANISDARNNRGQFRAGSRNDMNDKNEQSQSQGQGVPPDPFPELDSFILGLTPEQLKNTSIEDARREENFRFADQLHAKALARGENNAIELERLVQGRISTARSSDYW